jgi:hypothetical protein
LVYKCWCLLTINSFIVLQCVEDMHWCVLSLITQSINKTKGHLSAKLGFKVDKNCRKKENTSLVLERPPTMCCTCFPEFRAKSINNNFLKNTQKLTLCKTGSLAITENEKKAAAAAAALTQQPSPPPSYLLMRIETPKLLTRHEFISIF